MKKSELNELSKNSKNFILCVYYGNDNRWDQNLLNSIQQKLGCECNKFDGLQANFIYYTYDEAMAALFVVRGMNVLAQVGNIGKPPSKQSLDKAIKIMQESYRSENE